MARWEVWEDRVTVELRGIVATVSGTTATPAAVPGAPAAVPRRRSKLARSQVTPANTPFLQLRLLENCEHSGRYGKSAAPVQDAARRGAWRAGPPGAFRP